MIWVSRRTFQIPHLTVSLGPLTRSSNSLVADEISRRLFCISSGNLGRSPGLSTPNPRSGRPLLLKYWSSFSVSSVIFLANCIIRVVFRLRGLCGPGGVSSSVMLAKCVWSRFPTSVATRPGLRHFIDISCPSCPQINSKSQTAINPNADTGMRKVLRTWTA